MPEERFHDCDKMGFKGKIIIKTLPITHTSWLMYLTEFGITVYINYCPYCGVKLV
ncbi:hypothetical protein LCGC14_1642280 [marine sediment metagenome]|uniref:Uncharacterized protein n=1 Tax=marine sediment metagenome TaxID=412755 RepID=A0A0F9KYZ1_9ZZZZ